MWWRNSSIVQGVEHLNIFDLQWKPGRYRRPLAVLYGVICIALAFHAPAMAAEWRDNIKTLKVGFVAKGETERALERKEPFRRHLEDRLRLSVTLSTYPSYPKLIEAQTSGQLDYAIYSSSAFAIAQNVCACVEALAVAGDGEQIGYYSIILAHKSRTNINALEDLEGRSVLLGRTSSIAGALLPQQAFLERNLKPKLEHQERGMVNALTRIADADVDAVAAWSSLNGDQSTGFSRGTLTRLTRDGLINPDDVKIIWRSRLIPFGPHAVRSDLPELLKLELVEILLALPSDNRDLMEAAATPRLGPFREIRGDMYKPLIEALTSDASDTNASDS